MRLGAWGRVALVAAGVVALDQATKALVRSRIAEGDRVHVVPGVELVHTRNSGVAFGALSGGGAVVTVVVGVALVALLGYFATHVQRPLFWLPTGMLVGEVTDFVQIPLGFPAFNVADMSITLGVVVLLVVIEHDARARER
jgi:signal peptidase II